MASKKQSLFVFKSHVGKQVSGPKGVIKFMKEHYCTEDEEVAKVLRNAVSVEELSEKEAAAHLKSLEKAVKAAKKGAAEYAEANAPDEDEEAEEAKLEGGEEEEAPEEQPEEEKKADKKKK